MLLRVENLCVRYGPVVALKDVSLQVDFGQIVAVIGSPGSGRSTLLQAISGLVQPESGRIGWAASDERPHLLPIHGLPPHELVKLGIAFVPQSRDLIPSLSVRENLLLGAYQRTFKAAIQADVDDCYERFAPLQPLSKRSACSLRAHEQQMLALCRALMSRPRLLLVDEPVRGLPHDLAQRMLQTLQHLRNEGLTILLTDSHTSPITQLADVVYTLTAGQITQYSHAPAPPLLHQHNGKQSSLRSTTRSSA